MFSNCILLHSVFLLLSLFVTITFSIDSYSQNRDFLSVPSGVGDDDALFLTPYIEKGQIKKAQELAVVPPLLRGVESFAGYLTVNKSCSSNLFFWLFKSQLKNWEERPLVLWLQGGPGSSGMFGLFTELGPFWVTNKQKLKKRKFSWNRKYNLIFIDNPVGTGFSFTKSDSGYVKDESDVARDLYEAFVQLYTLFPALQKNKFFITGESYAGKYAPALAYKIYKMNKISSFKVPLAGVMIGNAWTDPINMMHYAVYLYQVGLIDESGKYKITQMENEARANIRAGKFLEALKARSNLFKELKALTGLRHEYDFVNDKTGEDGPEIIFINDPKTKRAIHVGSYNFSIDDDKSYEHLQDDIMQSARPLVEELLRAEEFPVLFYSGQLDIRVAYPLSVEFYRSLEWPHAKDYYTASRCQLRVGDDVAGYYKTAGTFTEVLVRNTGHMVPTTQPKWASALLDRFITNSSSFQCH